MRAPDLPQAERLSVELLQLLRDTGWSGDDHEVGHQEVETDEINRAEIHLSVSAGEHVAKLLTPLPATTPE